MAYTYTLKRDLSPDGAHSMTITLTREECADIARAYLRMCRREDIECYLNDAADDLTEAQMAYIRERMDDTLDIYERMVERAEQNGEWWERARDAADAILEDYEEIGEA